jgi:hypothetical protein
LLNQNKAMCCGAASVNPVTFMDQLLNVLLSIVKLPMDAATDTLSYILTKMNTIKATTEVWPSSKLIMGGLNADKPPTLAVTLNLNRRIFLLSVFNNWNIQRLERV